MGGNRRGPGLVQNLADGSAVGVEVKLEKPSRRWRQEVHRCAGETLGYHALELA